MSLCMVLSSNWECSPERTKLSLESLLGCLSFATAGCGSVSVLPLVTSVHGLTALCLRCFLALAFATWFFIFPASVSVSLLLLKGLSLESAFEVLLSGPSFDTNAIPMQLLVSLGLIEALYCYHT